MCYFYFAVIFIILFLVSFPIILTEICHDTRGCRTCLGRMSCCKVVFLFSCISVCPSNIPLSFENGTALLWLRIYYLSTANASVVRPKPRGFCCFLLLLFLNWLCGHWHWPQATSGNTGKIRQSDRLFWNWAIEIITDNLAKAVRALRLYLFLFFFFNAEYCGSVA